MKELTVLGLVAGVGFTMALFVAALALPDEARLGEAKLAVILASTCAMAFGLVAGRLLLRPMSTPAAAPLEAQAGVPREP